MLVIVALVAIGLAFLGTKIKRARDEQKIVQAILASGGQVQCTYFGMDARPGGPKETWFERLIDLDLETRATGVTLPGQGRSIVDADLERLAGLKELTSIDIHHGQVTGDGFAKLKSLQHLTYLLLDASGLTDDGLTQLADLAELENLSLSQEQLITDAGLDAFLRRKPMLRVLTIDGCSITGAGLKSLRFCPRLHHLAIDSIEDDCIVNIAGAPSLRSLRIAGKITDDGLQHLARLRSLQGLRLSGKITDGGLRHLGSFANLESLDVGGDEFTDDGLRHLAGLQSLTNLSISSARGTITDAGVEHIVKLKRLRFLQTSGTGISPEGIERLNRELPGIALR
ncbi:MAG: hypothetical protein HYX69_12865 [Planctomycetia bacterium]|nr:hypothetical protein [Planctomycetia bacterium]